MRWTDDGGEPAPTAMPNGHDLPLLDLHGLRQIVQLSAHLRQQGRGPPARSPSRARAAHRTLPPGNPSAPLATWRSCHAQTVLMFVPCAGVGSGLESARGRPQAPGHHRGSPPGIQLCHNPVRTGSPGGRRGSHHSPMPHGAMPPGLVPHWSTCARPRAGRSAPTPRARRARTSAPPGLVTWAGPSPSWSSSTKTKAAREPPPRGVMVVRLAWWQSAWGESAPCCVEKRRAARAPVATGSASWRAGPGPTRWASMQRGAMIQGHPMIGCAEDSAGP